MAPTPMRPIWWDGDSVAVIDQRLLPHQLAVDRWHTVADAAAGISAMTVRGAPLIGVAAASAMALAASDDPSDGALRAAAAMLVATRPTAVNLSWAVGRMLTGVLAVPTRERAARARSLADELTEDEVAACRAIGEHGAALLAAIHHSTGAPVQVMTHCNAGWLACVEWGTATAPVYVAAEQGIPVHVWVSETRPRNQGSSLTAWELGAAGIDHTVVVDNAAGHLLAHHHVDLVIVGADRIAGNGDAANKIGTSLKAYAAARFGVPFYVAAPNSTIDRSCLNGASIPIEERDGDEVARLAGIGLIPAGSRVRNWGFDVTPADCITAWITEDGVLRSIG